MNQFFVPDSPLHRMFTLLSALVLDSLIGDPVFPFHPVRLLGNFAVWAETWSRRLFRCQFDGSNTTAADTSPLRLRIAGLVAWFVVSLTAVCVPLIIHTLFKRLGCLPVFLADSLIIWASFAIKDLVVHAKQVQDGLEQDGDGPPLKGRQAVSMLVGRDTEKLDTKGVARACVESIAESSVDSMASPLLYAALLGPWAALLYRAINTMDSLFGHKNSRYRYFGWWAARTDDVANFIPARLSGFLTCLFAPLFGSKVQTALRIFLVYRKTHESPNAGHPEAAYAGVLDLRLGGPTWYREGLVEKGWIHPLGKNPAPQDINRAIRLFYLNAAGYNLILCLLLLLSAILHL